MVDTPHAVVGALCVVIAGAIARKTTNGEKPARCIWRAVGLVFAFCSHFFLDMIPHWDYVLSFGPPTGNLIIYAMLDVALAGTLIMVSTKGHFARFWGFWERRWLFVGAFCAVLPDGITYLSENLEREYRLHSYLINRFVDFHNAMHSQIHVDPLTGILIQIGVVTMACFLMRASIYGDPVIDINIQEQL